MVRDFCELCKSNKLVPFYTVYNMPCRLGTADTLEHQYKCYDLVYAECQHCLNVQILNIPPLNEVYEVNHNLDIVGGIWPKHFSALSEFILQNITNTCSVLEIGDPAAKLASLLVTNPLVKEWDLIEPNALPIDLLKVNILPIYFTPETELDKKYDIIILSHVLEHVIDIHSFINKVKSLLNPSGKIILSVPNMNVLLEKRSIPPGSVGFEHSFFLSENSVHHLFSRYGFKLEQKSLFVNHSIFFALSLGNDLVEKEVLELKNSFLSIFKEKEEKTRSYLAAIKTHKSAIFLYGSHIQSQLYRLLGIEHGISGVLDNSQSKHYKYLYGTPFLTYPLSHIAELDCPLVICDMGIYNDEIMTELKRINPTVRILT